MAKSSQSVSVHRYRPSARSLVCKPISAILSTSINKLRRPILLNILLTLQILTPSPSYSFSLGDFLRNMSGGSNTCNGRTCFNPGTTYGEWRYKSVKNGSDSNNCIGIYERQVKSYAGGWQYRTQETEGECPAYAIRQLTDNESRLRSDRLDQCKSFIERTYRRNTGNYVDTISNEICPGYASTGKYSQNQLDRLANQYSEAFKNDAERRAVERENDRAQAEYRFQTALSSAQAKRSKINSTGQLRAFVATTEGKDVYLNSFVIRSMDSGVTNGGSKIVDSNIRTELNGANYGERRIRILCNEGKNVGINAGSIASSGIPITGEMGRWACERYGFYHP